MICSRIRPFRLSILYLGAFVAIMHAFASTSSARAADHPRVLIDRSHEWLFAYDDLSEPMLRPVGFEVVMCDASLDTKAKLQDFDIVFVQQTGNNFGFSRDECRLLLDYVKGGGRMVLVGSPKCPVAGLAGQFGFAFRPHECKLPLRAAESLCREFGAEPTLQTRPMYCRLEGPRTGQPLLADSAGAIVAAAIEFGKGKVICFADDGAYWDFCAQRDKDLKVPNMPTTVALFKCLLSEEPPAGEGPAVVRIPAEQELELAGLLVRYSNPVVPQAKTLLDVLPRIAELVAKANGGRPPTDKFTVNILAASGGGWSGGREIGIQCGGSPAANIAVIAHELTHSWTGPLPGIIGEGWASMVGMRVTKLLGYPADADRERRSWQEQYERAEAGGKRLDITLADTDRRLFGPCEAKMMWMIERLEAQHGPDFMPRFLEICHALKGRQSPTIHEVLYYFSLTAGEDLAPAYQRLGINYQPPPAISPEELQQRLEAYRQEE